MVNNSEPHTQTHKVKSVQRFSSWHVFISVTFRSFGCRSCSLSTFLHVIDCMFSRKVRKKTQLEYCRLYKSQNAASNLRCGHHLTGVPLFLVKMSSFRILLISSSRPIQMIPFSGAAVRKRIIFLEYNLNLRVLMGPRGEVWHGERGLWGGEEGPTQGRTQSEGLVKVVWGSCGLAAFHGG